MATGPSETAVIEALRSVMEPMQQKDIVTLQIVKGVQVRDGAVSLLLALPAPAAPLREKIERDPRQPRYLKTLRGIGYRFENGR